MEENTNRNDVVTIDLKDLCAEFLVHWKLIICLGVIFALLLGAFSYIRSGNGADSSSTSATSSSSVDTNVTYTKAAFNAAKAKLNPAQVENVEGIYAQYKAYQDNNKVLQDYMRDSAVFMDKEKQPVLKRSQYYITTDIQNIDEYYSVGSLGLEDWGEIKHILNYGQDDTVNGLTSMVTFSSQDNPKNNQSFIEVNVGSGTASSNGTYHVILTINILADSQDQSDQISDIVDKGIQNATAALNNVGDTTSATFVSENYNNDVTIYVQKKQQDVIDNSNTIMNNISTLKSGPITSFSEDEKAYFDMLSARDQQAQYGKDATAANAASTAASVGRSVSGKYVAIGAIVGILLGLLFVALAYIFRRTVKTVSDVRDRWGFSVLDSYYFEEKTHDPFKIWARRLRGRNADSLETKAVMLAEDIRILADKQNITSIFIQRAESDKEAASVISKVSEALKDAGIKLIAGDALNDPAQLKQMAEADGVIDLIHIRKTSTDSVERYTEYCRRYNSTLLGAVTVANTPE